MRASPVHNCCYALRAIAHQLSSLKAPRPGLMACTAAAPETVPVYQDSRRAGTQPVHKCCRFRNTHACNCCCTDGTHSLAPHKLSSLTTPNPSTKSLLQEHSVALAQQARKLSVLPTACQLPWRLPLTICHSLICPTIQQQLRNILLPMPCSCM